MNPRAHSRTAQPGRHHYARAQNRLAIAVALSLLVHAFALSLQFGLPGLGLPGLELPWSQRRAQPVGLSVVLSNTKPEANAVREAGTATVEPDSSSMVAQVPERTPPPQYSASPASARVQLAPVDVPGKNPVAAAPGTRTGIEKPNHTPAAARPRKRRKPALAGSGPRLMTQDNMGQNTFSVPLPVLDEPDHTVASSASARPELAQPDVPDLPEPSEPEPVEPPVQDPIRAEEEAAQRAREAEAEAQEALRQAQELEARRQAEALAAQDRQRREDAENARRALELEAQRREEQRQQDEARAQRLAQELAAQQQAAALAQQQAEQKRLEEENARRIQEMEARRREALKLQEEAKAQREAMEQDARRQAQEAALRQKQAEERAAIERAQTEARRQAEASADRQREQALAERGRAADAAGMTRNAGGISLAARALDQARKADTVQDIPPLPHQLPQAADPARRRSVFGRVEHDVGLMMYVESWRLKIERNGRLNYKQSLVESAYTEPVVTVAVRSDGSIEEIIFHRSSGRPELDEAVRRIIRLNARYAAFPPELARRFDVIEIRHTWNFDDKLRLLEEVR